MRKNKMMRTAAVLGVATMLTASVISGTFAKYTTSSTGSDSARVAKWGLNDSSSITLDNLFSDKYTNDSKLETVKSSENSKDVIAPGTKGSATIKFEYTGKNGESNSNISAPEVGYTFVVDTEGSTCAESIKNNPNIVWKLDDDVCTATEDKKTSWDVLLEKIQALDGNKEKNDSESKPANYYAPGELPAAFYGEASEASKSHTVSWEWKFEDTNAEGETAVAEQDSAEKTQDVTDTKMGNADELANVTLKITITATQVD